MASVPIGDATGGGGGVEVTSFQLKIDNFASSEFPVYSEPRVVPGLPGTWRIRVDKVELSETYIGLYLESDIKTHESCLVSGELSISLKQGGAFSRKFSGQMFSNQANTHGFDEFLRWTLMDSIGFIDNNQVLCEVKMQKTEGVKYKSDLEDRKRKHKVDIRPSGPRLKLIKRSLYSQPLDTKTPIYANSATENQCASSGIGNPHDPPNLQVQETNNNSSIEFFKNVHVYSNRKPSRFITDGLDSVTIWAKFFTFSWRARPQFNPYEASDGEVADFAHYLDYTETLNRNYLEALAAALDKYHNRKDGFFKDADKLLKRIKECGPTFKILKTNNKLRYMPLKTYYTKSSIGTKVNVNSTRTWEDFLSDSKDYGYDPFKATPNQVCRFIKNLIQAKPSERSSLLSQHCDYSSLVQFLISGLDDILEETRIKQKSLTTSSIISSLVATALACDEGILSNSVALNLLPKHNYVKMRRTFNDGEERFWNMKIVQMAFADITEERISVERAATELGVTPEMIFSKLHINDFRKDCFPSLAEFIEHESGPLSKFWKKFQVKELLVRVRNREETSASAAAKIGVSRLEIERRCGGVKSKEEIEAEEELERIARVNKQEEAAKKRIKKTDLDKQIHFSEMNENDLCDYEKKRLANLRDRKAMMEKLDIVGDKLEIRRLNKVVRNQPSPKEEVPRREKSSRIQRLKENRRLTSDKLSTSYQDAELRKTPNWFGNLFSKREESFRHVVPKFDLNTKELIEITNDYRSSQIFLESITMESKIINEEPFHDDNLDWSKLNSSEEYIVSTSAITALGSLGDFVTYGTRAGGVGVLLAQRSLTFRPHSGPVTGLLTSGAGILSSSLDGTVRRLDLEKQLASLEYCWEASGDTKQGVCGMVDTGDHSYLMDCRDKMVQLDLRSKQVKVLCDIQPFSPSDFNTRRIDIEPVKKHLFSVCRDNTVMVWDLRRTGSPVHEFEMQDSPNFASWSPDGSCLLVSNEEGLSQIFDVARRVELTAEYLKCRIGFTTQELPGLGGDLWCSWQGSTLFQMSRNKNRANVMRKTVLSAVNCKR